MAVNWKSLLRDTAGIGIAGLIMFICIVYFAVGLATRSHPSAHEITGTGVSDTVHIFRNSFGIPHIVCKTTSDLVYAQGFVHAQDRLWQMDVWRRTAKGTLAEIFGPDLAPTDAFLRSLDLRRIVKDHYKGLSHQTKEFLKAYTNGVNAYINANSESLPFEFDALGYHPIPWQPEDCLLIIRMLALHQSPALYNDLVYTQIAKQRGVDAMLQYIPATNDAGYALDSTHAAPSPYIPKATLDTTKSSDSATTNLLSALLEVQRTIGLPSTLHASNSWAVGRGEEGAIVANDPHLAVGMPSRWYQIHLSSANMNVTGLSIPGIPFVVSGRNDSVAWGITSAMVDDIDYAVERVDQKNSNYYLDNHGQRVKFTYRRDTIRIRNAPDSLIDLRFTVDGCVISDAHPLHKQTTLMSSAVKPTENLMAQTCLIMRWTGFVASDEVNVLYQMNIAKRPEDMYQAAHSWGVPALVVTMGSRSGTVSTYGMGFVPNRKNIDFLLPHAGWDNAQGWDGVLRLSDLHPIEKRNAGFVASANNRLTPTGAPSQTILSELTSRIKRIEDQLNVYTMMTARDAQVLQQDVTSPYAIGFTKEILPVLKRARKRFNQTELTAMASLEKWDGAMTPVSHAASIHAVFLQRFMWNTFEDELGTPLYNLWVYPGGIATRRIREILQEPTHVLFDDVRTKPKENLSWIAVRSFMEAVQELTQRFGSNTVSSWTWGHLHQVTFKHPMGMHQLLGPVVNAGPFEVGGSSTTVFNTEWSIQYPFDVRNTASARVISDFADSVQYSVLPGGISGQALDGHYSDQMQLWLKGGYVRIPVSRNPDVTFRLFQLLVPSSVVLSAS